jgi:hypothetical protein
MRVAGRRKGADDPIPIQRSRTDPLTVGPQSGAATTRRRPSPSGDALSAQALRTSGWPQRVLGRFWSLLARSLTALLHVARAGHWEGCMGAKSGSLPDVMVSRQHPLRPTVQGMWARPQPMAVRFHEDAGFLASNLLPEHTGVEGGMVWIFAGEFSRTDAQHGPRILVVPGRALVV